MAHFLDALGGFDPQEDADAAMKFALNSLLMDGKLTQIVRLVTENHEYSGVEGDPGWVITRRDRREWDAPRYSSWPHAAKFCAHVDPEAYLLEYPNCYMTAGAFYDLLGRGLDAYISRTPKASSAIAVIRSVIQQSKL